MHTHSIFIALSLLILAPAHGEAQWETVEHRDHHYVTARSIQAFYGFPTMEVINDQLVLENKQVTCSLPLQGTEAVLNGVRFHLEFPVVKQDDRYLVSQLTLTKIIDPVLRPQYLKPAHPLTRLILHPEPMPPGHEGADVTLEIAMLARRELESQGFKVQLTRENSDPAELEQQLKVINAADPSLLIALRVIDAAKPQSGLRTWVLAPVGVSGLASAPAPNNEAAAIGNQNDGMNIAFGTAVHGTVLLATRRPDRGLARTRNPLLAESRHPALILEVGNLSNESDAPLLKNDQFQQTVAKAIASAAVKAKLATRPRKAK